MFYVQNNLSDSRAHAVSSHSPNNSNYYNSFEAKQFIARNMISQSRVLLSESHLTRSTSSNSLSRLHRSFTAITPLKSQAYANSQGQSISSNNTAANIKKKNEELARKRKLEIDLQLLHSNPAVKVQDVSCIYDKEEAAIPVSKHDKALVLSLEKENRLLKSEIQEHRHEMTGFEMKVQSIQDDNRKLRHALKKTASAAAAQTTQAGTAQPVNNNLQMQANEQLLKQSSMNYDLLERIRCLQEALVIAEADRDDYCKKSVELAKKVKIIIAKKKEEKDKSQADIDELRITITQLEKENELHSKEATNWRHKYSQISIQCEGLLNHQQAWLQREQEVQDVLDLDKLQVNTLINQHEFKIAQLQEEILKEQNQAEQQMKVFNTALKAANAQFQEASERGKVAQEKIGKLEEQILLISGENNRLKRIEEEYKKSKLREVQQLEDIKQLKDQLSTLESAQSMERMIKKLNGNNSHNMVGKTTQTNRQLYGEMATQTDSITPERQTAANEEELKQEIARLNNHINELMMQIARDKNNIISDPAENTLSFPFLTDSVAACPNPKQLEPLISSTQCKKQQIQIENERLKQRLTVLESQYPSEYLMSKLNHNHSSFLSNVGSHADVCRYGSLQVYNNNNNQNIHGQSSSMQQQQHKIQLQSSINNYLIPPSPPPHALTHQPAASTKTTTLNNQPYLYS